MSKSISKVDLEVDQPAGDETRGSAVGGLHHPTTPTRHPRPRHRGERNGAMTIMRSKSDMAVWGRMRSFATCISGGERVLDSGWISDRVQWISAHMYTNQCALLVFVALLTLQHVKEIFTDMCIPVAASPQDLEV